MSGSQAFRAPIARRRLSRWEQRGLFRSMVYDLEQLQPDDRAEVFITVALPWRIAEAVKAEVRRRVELGAAGASRTRAIDQSAESDSQTRVEQGDVPS